MRTKAEVEEARCVVADNMALHKPDSTEYALLAGASVALQWTCHDEKGPGTLSLLIEDWRKQNALPNV